MLRRPRPPVPALCAIALALLGCEACGSTTHDPGPVAPAPPSTTTSAPPATSDPVPSDPPSDPPPPDPPAAPEPGPAIEIATRVARGHVIVTLANEGHEAVRFASQLTLETHEGDAWIVEEGSFVASIDDGHPLPACAELVPGASLELRFTVPTRDAERRFVLARCEGTGRTEGPGFRAAP